MRNSIILSFMYENISLLKAEQPRGRPVSSPLVDGLGTIRSMGGNRYDSAEFTIIKPFLNVPFFLRFEPLCNMSDKISIVGFTVG